MAIMFGTEKSEGIQVESTGIPAGMTEHGMHMEEEVPVEHIPEEEECDGISPAWQRLFVAIEQARDKATSAGGGG